jgi:hypothetical protein
MRSCPRGKTMVSSMGSFGPSAMTPVMDRFGGALEVELPGHCAARDLAVPRCGPLHAHLLFITSRNIVSEVLRHVPHPPAVHVDCILMPLPRSWTSLVVNATPSCQG